MVTAVATELVTIANNINALTKLYKSFAKEPKLLLKLNNVSTAFSKRRQDDVDADIPAKHVKVEPDSGSSSG
ncbi:hypothetical protein DL764_003573 [Monosporascus ibericus]|uniref:Uncharacterized protein n=1 Tax=Monosporascus ibericus TaxID=155417 RepID=A0A4Q4TFY8_9PEZI|nr:hypothetical protein DL764_003573 [Monosporascus ibericus]